MNPRFGGEIHETLSQGNLIESESAGFQSERSDLTLVTARHFRQSAVTGSHRRAVSTVCIEFLAVHEKVSGAEQTDDGSY
jgi:hypothetical protein